LFIGPFPDGTLPVLGYGALVDSTDRGAKEVNLSACSHKEGSPCSSGPASQSRPWPWRPTAGCSTTSAWRSRALVEKTDRHLPAILAHAERISGQLDAQLPQLVSDSRAAVEAVDRHLPRILESTELSADRLADLSASFGEYKGLMGAVHAASQDKGLLAYGSSVLSWIEGQPAQIGRKAPGPGGGLRHARPAREWAAAARKDAHFLSLFAGSKAELLHGLARADTASEWHVQVGGQAPRPLAEWVKEKHPESREPRGGATPAPLPAKPGGGKTDGTDS
jgi:hypothetical protein